MVEIFKKIFFHLEVHDFGVIYCMVEIFKKIFFHLEIYLNNNTFYFLKIYF
jgi:hypothetical protein